VSGLRSGQMGHTGEERSWPDWANVGFTLDGKERKEQGESGLTGDSAREGFEV
jgi:hypothetical protein